MTTTIPENLILFFNKTTDEFQITTKLRRAHFLAQITHESQDFKYVEENLNYSATGLMKTFSKYFPDIEGAATYARNPIAIANRVYANRMGNGDELSGDGWKYHGRGYIQLTGRDNYKAFSNFTQIDFVNNPTILTQPEYAMRSAGWFWDVHKLNQIADRGTGDEVATQITKVINGGLNGIEDRLNRFANFYQTI